ncbi:MAG: SIR2 family protein [Peptoanaerobacter stomatis]
MDIDMDNLKKNIQSFFDQGTVTIVGSGLSCAEGISGMKALSEKLMEDVSNKLSNEDMECWRNIEETLNNGTDLESTLQQNKATNNIEKAIIESAYELISSEDISIFKEIIEKSRTLRFSEYLSCFNVDLYNLVVITTNYDLLIEYACEIKGLVYSDSYYGKIISKYSPENAEKEMLKGIKRGKKPMNHYKPHIKIYKPHGSINWKLINGKLNKINHVNCGTPCIITPGSNKYEKGYEEPFDYHIGKMGQEIDNAKRLIFIGYGFNDNHLETHLNKPENISKPKLIVTRTLYGNAKKIVDNSPNTIAIEEMKINDKSCGTRIYFEKQIYEIKDKKIWDIAELIKEVF